MQVEKVFNVSNPDHLEVEKAKKALKVSLNSLAYILSFQEVFTVSNCQCLQEQEHSLVDAIARLAEASADETGKF